ncbi:hypothetical protein BHM03_00062182 [Ensete ventricosum]|nr:hypothetical protein BHM03_00062182 [Ensete ventricosum]
MVLKPHIIVFLSVLCRGSTGKFIFFYCKYYYPARSDMSGFMHESFFFSYTTCICYGFFLMLGTVGFVPLCCSCGAYIGTSNVSKFFLFLSINFTKPSYCSDSNDIKPSA